MLWVIWLLVLAVIVTVYFKRLFSRFSKHGVKNFAPLPLIGNALDMILQRAHIVEVIGRTYYAFPHHRFVGHFEFINPVVIVRDPELIKKITIKDFEHFVDHRTLIDDKVDQLFGRNLFSLKGEEWKDMRSTLSPAFTSSKIRLMVPFMVEVAEQMIKSIQANIKKSGLNYVDVDTKDLSTRCSNDVIASCAFGLKVNSHTDLNNEFYIKGKQATEFGFFSIVKTLVSSSLPAVAKLLNLNVFAEETRVFFKDLILGTMKNREANNIIRHDMIHLLMEAKKGKLTHDQDNTSNDADTGFATAEESNIGKKVVNKVWSDNDLVAQALIFFLAGFETVSTAFSFIQYELATNPKIQERLYAEIRENEVKNNNKFDYTSVQNMTYLDMVVSEALRLWPPAVAMDRKCVKKYNMGKPSVSSKQDYYINEGEIISIPLFAIHRDPKFYPDPLQFDPERFSEENKHKIIPSSYAPFGLGPRNCVGSRFALCELKVLVYQLFLRMELTPCEKTCIPADIATDNVRVRLKGGNWLRMTERTN